MWRYAVCAWFWKVHVECHDIRISFTSLSFCLFDCYVCGFLPCDDHQFLLMWADVRALDNGNGNRDAAAWWVWTGIGLSMEPSTEEMLLVRFLSFWTRVVLLLMYCTYVRPSDAYFLLLRICLWYCVPSYPIFTLWISMYVAFYLNWIYLFNWDVTQITSFINNFNNFLF